MKDDRHDGVLLEDIYDKLQHLAEGVSVLLEGNQESRPQRSGFGGQVLARDAFQACSELLGRGEAQMAY
ncbi:MAG: hypothetical protein ABSD78_02980, partial [Acidimicrobiales bacterium]